MNAQTTYYVSNSGSDSNDGLSTSTAWATISKVESTIVGGDVVLFNRGDVWRIDNEINPPSGSSGNPTTFGAYGAGNKPKIYGSLDKSNTGDWSDLGSNIWQTSNSVEYLSFSDSGNIVFNGTDYGVYKESSGDLSGQGDFWHDQSTGTVRLYSVGNPASYYTSIEVVQNIHAFNIQAKNYIDIKDLDIRYFGRLGVTASSSSNWNVSGCNFEFIGGCRISSSGVRFGNGVELWDGGSNVVIEGNRFSQVYDAVVTAQGSGDGHTISNVIFRNNTMEYYRYGLEIWHTGASTVNDVYFLNNTLKNANGGFGTGQRTTGDNDVGTHIAAASMVASSSNLEIRNNIFYESKDYAMTFWRSTDFSKYDVDYNIYYESTGDVFRIGATNTLYDYDTEISDFKTDTGFEVNGVFSDPLLTGFEISDTSPAYDTGVTTSNVTEDFNGVSRPQGSGYDIGAYEWTEDVSTPTPDMPTFSQRKRVKGSQIKTATGNATIFGQ